MKGPAVFVKNAQADIKGSFSDIKQGYKFGFADTWGANALNSAIAPGDADKDPTDITPSEFTPLLSLLWLECDTATDSSESSSTPESEPASGECDVA